MCPIKAGGGCESPGGVRALSEGSKRAVLIAQGSWLIQWQTQALSSVYSLDVSPFRAVGLNTVPGQCFSPYVTRGQEPWIPQETLTSCTVTESMAPIKQLYQPLCPLINFLSTNFWAFSTAAVLQVLSFIRFLGCTLVERTCFRLKFGLNSHWR